MIIYLFPQRIFNHKNKLKILFGQDQCLTALKKMLIMIQHYQNSSNNVVPWIIFSKYSFTISVLKQYRTVGIKAFIACKKAPQIYKIIEHGEFIKNKVGHVDYQLSFRPAVFVQFFFKKKAYLYHKTSFKMLYCKHFLIHLVFFRELFIISLCLNSFILGLFYVIRQWKI